MSDGTLSPSTPFVNVARMALPLPERLAHLCAVAARARRRNGFFASYTTSNSKLLQPPIVNHVTPAAKIYHVANRVVACVSVNVVTINRLSVAAFTLSDWHKARVPPPLRFLASIIPAPLRMRFSTPNVGRVVNSVHRSVASCATKVLDADIAPRTTRPDFVLANGV